MTATPGPDSAYEQAAAWRMRLETPVGLEEELELELWLDADHGNREALAHIAGAWRAVGEIADRSEIIALRADALKAMRSTSRRRWQSRLVRRWAAPATVAACLVLAMTMLVSLLPRSQIYTTAIGERRVIALADGSRISLDAASSVEVRYDRERRGLRLLAGRARFDVARDPRRPFAVSAGARMVVATGTAFSVELVQTEMRVVLYEGAVAVLEDGAADQPPRHVALVADRRVAADRSLLPGTALTVSRQPLAAAQIEAVDPLRSRSWEQGQLVFSDEPLGMAVERVNRYARTRLTIADPQVAKLPVSGAFNADDTEAFVDGVAALYGLRSARQDDTIVLARR